MDGAMRSGCSANPCAPSRSCSGRRSSSLRCSATGCSSGGWGRRTRQRELRRSRFLPSAFSSSGSPMSRAPSCTGRGVPTCLRFFSSWSSRSTSRWRGGACARMASPEPRWPGPSALHSTPCYCSLQCGESVGSGSAGCSVSASLAEAATESQLPQVQMGLDHLSYSEFHLESSPCRRPHGRPQRRVACKPAQMHEACGISCLEEEAGDAIHNDLRCTTDVARHRGDPGTRRLEQDRRIWVEIDRGMQQYVDPVHRTRVIYPSMKHYVGKPFRLQLCARRANLGRGITVEVPLNFRTGLFDPRAHCFKAFPASV